MIHLFQLIGIAIISVVFSSGLSNEEFGNSTVPDAKTFNCSFRDIQVNHFPSQIVLCSLNENIKLTVVNTTRIIPQSTTSGGYSAPSKINIHRYYYINPFDRITSANKKTGARFTDYAKTNCAIYSTSCLVSDVTFECNDNQDDSGVCIKHPQFTADSYGYQSRWSIKVHPPQSLSNNNDVKGANVVITVSGGPCYYCDNPSKPNLKLSTIIGFYCDERIMDKGKPRIIQNPMKTKPQAIFYWNTSLACFDFIPKENCYQFQFSNICKGKNFSCYGKNHKYSIPASANHSITTSGPDGKTTYIFGFCAHDVNCATEDKNVMICKKEGETSLPLAYYTDSITFIARPTGFVLRINENWTLKAVISFECVKSVSGPITSFTVLENDNLPILLTLKHACFCPNSPPCQEVAPTASKMKIKGLDVIDITFFIIGGLFFLVIMLFVVRSFCRYRKCRNNGGAAGVGVGDGGDGGDDGDRVEGETQSDATSQGTSYQSFGRSTPLSDVSYRSFPSTSSRDTRTTESSISEETPLLYNGTQGNSQAVSTV